MVSIHLMGGLGNQLFQIFNTMAYAYRFKKDFVFPYSETLRTGVERPTYWTSLFKNIHKYTCPEMDIPNLPILRERGFLYNQIPDIPQDFMFYGYFQSYKYFEDQYNNIMETIGIRDIQNQIQVKIKNSIDFDSTISLHFRLGDYKVKQQHHPVMPVEYYIKAIEHIHKTSMKDHWTFLYFYEKDDEEIVMKSIDTLKTTFPSACFMPVNHTLSDWEQMITMSLCKHNIIANSSFSWWGAYFNENEDKIVCYPSVWFGRAFSPVTHNTRDLFPNKWFKIIL